jgi:hypothetical protein
VNRVPAGNHIIGSAAPVMSPNSEYLLGIGVSELGSIDAKGMFAEYPVD